MKIDRNQIELIMAENIWTVEQAAKKCNISKPTFHRAMNEMEISPKTVGRIARGLKVSVDEIIKIRKSRHDQRFN